MKTLLYIYPQRSSFVAADADILKKQYRVREFWFDGAEKYKTPWLFIRQLWFLLWYCRNDTVIVSQFSGYHSFLPSLVGKLFHRTHVIILHGTECNNFPEFNYGYKSRPLLQWFSGKSMKWASLLLPVSPFLIRQEYHFMKTTYAEQGYRAFYPAFNTPVRVLLNGASPDKFYITHASGRKPNSFITVAAGIGQSNRMMIKGLDLVIELARRMPDCSFTFIGVEKEFTQVLPPNIQCIGFTPNETLIHFYNQNSFYLQLSVTEGMPISLLEAMLSGCIPIVSAVGIMPELVGEYGYVLNRKDPDMLVLLVQTILRDYTEPDRSLLYQRVKEHYSLEKREKGLLETLQAFENH